MFREIKHCRLCGSGKLKDVLDLGVQYVVDFVPSKDSPLHRAPLKLTRCTICELVQLKHTVHPDLMYKKFWYRSNIQEAMRKALAEVVESAQNLVEVREGDAVLDIGTNNGELLGNYPAGISTVGIDPCGELIDEGLNAKRMDIGIKGYFSKDVVQRFGPFKIITAIAMFYDVESPVGFLEECKAVLKSDGVLIIQMNYLPAMLENNAVDNIEHEHLTYFSMSTMKLAADKAGLEVVGAETNDVNGGSIRVYLTHKNSGLDGLSTQKQLDSFMTSVNLIHREQKLGLDTDIPYAEFGERVTEYCKALQEYLTKQAAQGEKIYIYGASTRGTVLMQLLNLDAGVIQGAAERDEKKYGLHMVGGTWPKIYDEDYCRSRATMFLCLPWHFGHSILERETAWMKAGGKMVMPLPEPRVINGSGDVKYLVSHKRRVAVMK